MKNFLEGYQGDEDRSYDCQMHGQSGRRGGGRVTLAKCFGGKK